MRIAVVESGIDMGKALAYSPLSGTTIKERGLSMGKRGSGVLLHITSLPSIHGVGDFGPEAYRFADFLEDADQALWQILPLNPTDNACGNSPYFSSSSFAMDPIFISLEKLSNQGLLSGSDFGLWPGFSSGTADYDHAIQYKMQMLKKAHENFKRSDGNPEYEDFCRENSLWLHDFALFSALKKKFNGEAWNRWPKPIRNRNPEVLAEAEDALQTVMEAEKFYQYLLLTQWLELKSYCNKKGIKIIGDLPIYVSYDSCDVWSNHPIFKLDEDKMPCAVSGVPPDYFSKTGQLWNNPVYRWDVLRKTGYNWWVRRMAHTLHCYDLVRIDHFRGLVKYWEIPAGEKTALNGKWAPVPSQDFFNTLLKHFPDFPVIAEDLGVITPDVIEIMEEFKFPGMKVLIFAFGEDDPMHPYLPHTYTRDCVAYTGTHDNNTLMGWFKKEAGEQEKQRLFRYLYKKNPVEKLNWELIRLLMMSVADTVIIPMQDILGLGEEARMNQPAVASGNWAWRLLPDQITSAVIGRLSTLTKIYGRT